MTRKFILLQKVAIVSASMVLGFTACKKKAEVVPDTTMVLFKHASPDLANIEILVDDKKVTTAPLAFSNNSGYIKVAAGARTIKATTTSGVVLSTKVVTLTKDRNYSVFVGNRSSSLETILVDDVMTGPALAGKAHIRILNMCPDGLAFNATLSGSTTNIFTGASFKNATTFSVFDSPAAGTTVALQVKHPTTNAVVSTINANIIPGKVYTIVLRGFVTPPTGNTNSISSTIILNN